MTKKKTSGKPIVTKKLSIDKKWVLLKIRAEFLPELRRIAAGTGRSMGREVEWLARDALLWRASIQRFEERQKENKS